MMYIISYTQVFTIIIYFVSYPSHNEVFYVSSFTLVIIYFTNILIRNVCQAGWKHRNGLPRLLGCEKPTVFNPKTGTCDDQANVPGCEGYYVKEEVGQEDRDRIAQEIREQLIKEFGLDRLWYVLRVYFMYLIVSFVISLNINASPHIYVRFSYGCAQSLWI